MTDADYGMTMGGQPAIPVLVAEYNALVTRATATEANRVALSEALGLGTGAPWGAIRERAAEVVAEVSQLTEASRRLLGQRQEMAEERFAWQERGDRAERRVQQLEAVLPAPADRPAVDLPATTCSARHRSFDDGRECIRAAQHHGDHIDERGFHWSDTVAIYPISDGTFRTGINPRADLRRLADEAQQAEAWPPSVSWRVETRWHDGTWRKYGPSWDTDHAWMKEHLAQDSTDTKHTFRLARATTTYTVETEGAQQADGAVDDLTAQENRDLADDLGLQLYRAQDALAFVAECCDIADREQRPVTTGVVREWLKGARCGRELLAEHEAQQPEAEAQPEQFTEAERGFLAYALHLADEQMVTGGGKFGNEDRAALVTFQRLAQAGCTCDSITEAWVEMPHAADCPMAEGAQR